VEEARFLDHHIEEILGTISRRAQTGEGGLDLDNDIQPLG